MIFDYETLKLIIWIVVGVLLIGFAVMDGFDMGIGALLPFLGKTDEERRVIINSIGQTWEGNQVWFISAAGALFAAWPIVYAVSFSGFYIAMLLALFALFFRPVGFDYRSKLADPRWRATWDWGLFVGGLVPALIFGIAFGNLLLGVPFHFDEYLRAYYTGSFWELFHPFALLAGIVSVSMLIMHGAVFLQIRTTDVIYDRCKKAVVLFGLIFMVSFALAGVWIAYGIDGFKVTSMPALDALPNPLAKTVEIAPGAWMSNYETYSWSIIFPILAFSGASIAIIWSMLNAPILAFISSSMSIIGVIMTAGMAMFPFVMPSSTNPNHSLIVWDSASSYLTLTIIFWASVIFIPIIVFYTSWVYSVLRGKITVEHIRDNNEYTTY